MIILKIVKKFLKKVLKFNVYLIYSYYNSCDNLFFKAL